MKRAVCILILSSFAMVGCKKGDTGPAPAGSPPATPAKPSGMPGVAAPSVSVPAPPPPPGSAGVPAAAAPAAPAATAQPQAAEDPVISVTHAVQSFMIANNRAPKDLNELVTGGFVKALPPPPAGKKFVYDPSKMAISLVNQ